MGFAAGENIDPECRFPSMFEPIHGSVPKYTGQRRVNQIGSIEAVGMMLDPLGEHAAADAVGMAIGDVLQRTGTHSRHRRNPHHRRVGCAIADRIR